MLVNHKLPPEVRPKSNFCGQFNLLAFFKQFYPMINLLYQLRTTKSPGNKIFILIMTIVPLYQKVMSLDHR